MLHHRLSRLGLVALAVCSAPCVELPIVRIIIGPDGALVERAGRMPAGDEVVDGLPLGIDPARLAVTIDGVATPPAIRLDLPEIPPAPVPDAQWQARLVEAQAAFDLAGPTIDVALQRIRLSRAVLRLMPGPGNEEDDLHPTVVERPDTAQQPVPSPVIQQGILRFVSANREQAERDIIAARRARSAARIRLIALDEELERLRVPTRFTARLPLPGAAGRNVRLQYAVERAAWAPAYSIEVVAGVSTLVREAFIDVPRDQHWTSGRLELITRSPSPDLVLKDLLVPVLELGDELVTKRMSERRRALAKGGGTRASESSVDIGLRAAKALQQPDGSWSTGVGSAFLQRSSSRSGSASTTASATASATALAVLTYLGAGYDHKTPNKYRTTVAAGMSWLARHVVTGDLSSQALVLCALAEGFAMTNDPELKPLAEQALTRLAERVVGGQELDVLLYRRGPFVGPEALAWMTLGAKSAIAAGLEGEAPTLLAIARTMLPELLGHADRDEAAVVRLFVSAFTRSQTLHQEDPPPVSEWIERSGTWWREGRPELIYFATNGLFQYGGAAWEMWNNTVRDRMVQLQILGERSGFATASPHPHGEATALLFLTLPLEVYYRYQQVGSRKQDASIFGNRRREDRIEELAPLVNVNLAAKSWPVRIDAGPARLVDGQRMRVQIGRIPLPGRLGLRAVPASGAGAWRMLTTRNPLTIPLLAGTADVVVDGERLGQINLPFTEPGAALQLDLGRDDRVLVTRSEERADDEAWGKRTRTYTTRIRVDAPPGLYDSIRIDEAMPVPKDGSIQLVSLAPAIAPELLDRRLLEDPVWHLDLDLRKPPVEGAISWQLRFPATVRPRIDHQRPGGGAAEAEENAEEDDESAILRDPSPSSGGKP
ncbi:MAG: hypothetical protein H0W78_09905 [Planctomycetes bacterium]|nr:hypothetical protein [Planctomycetota bacterium]